MRKLIFITITALLFPVFGFANGNLREDYSYIDYKKSEIYIQYGAPSILELTNKFEHSIIEKKYYKSKSSNYSGVGGVGYKYLFTPYISGDVYFGISKADMQIIEKQTNKSIYKSKVTSYSFLIGASWIYFREGMWEASCGASLGIVKKDEKLNYNQDSSVIKENENKIAFGYNLTATRIRYGGGVLGAYLEVGFGYKGLVNAGINVRF